LVEAAAVKGNSRKTAEATGLSCDRESLKQLIIHKGA
jgi:hypothetical protein